MSITVLKDSLPWPPELRASMSRLLYAFETSVRMRSKGGVTLLLENAMVSRDEEMHSIILSMGVAPDMFAWEDEVDESLRTDVVITLYLRHMVDSTVDLLHPGTEEPFATFPLKMDTFGDDLADAVPGLFPDPTENPKPREIN